MSEGASEPAPEGYVLEIRLCGMMGMGLIGTPNSLTHDNPVVVPGQQVGAVSLGTRLTPRRPHAKGLRRETAVEARGRGAEARRTISYVFSCTQEVG